MYVAKLSKILKSNLVLGYGGQDGNGSWGIFVYPKKPDHVIKLFFDSDQFLSEKNGYDRVLREPCLRRFANPYDLVSVEVDTPDYKGNQRLPPFDKAILLPFLSSPPWKTVGKLGGGFADIELSRAGVNVEKLKDELMKIGIAFWEATFLTNPNSSEVKGLDFTYSEVVLDSYSDPIE